LIRWVLWGAGTAGRARARALRDHPLGELVGVWRGRHAPSLGVPIFEDPERSLRDADGVIITSPSEAHEAQVLSALASSRHVIVDYPLARTAEGAQRCFDAARRAGRTLHVGHIELASPATQRMQARTLPGEVTAGELAFSAPGAPWPDGGTHAWHSLARVTRCIAVGGPVRAVDVARSDGGQIHATLFHTHGGRVVLHLHRGGDGPRTQRWTVSTRDGSWTEVPDEAGPRPPVAAPSKVGGPPNDAPRGLFGLDMDAALARVVHGSAPVWPEWLEIHALDVVTALSAVGARDVAPPPS
jgi:predicted dehydrogenase